MFMVRRYSFALGSLAASLTVCCSGISAGISAGPPESNRETANAVTATTATQEPANEPANQPVTLNAAIARGYQVLRTGVKNYPEHRDCFSCHHQALPLMALSLDSRRDLDTLPAHFYEQPLSKSIAAFTESAFASKRAAMREGTGVGGRALTVAYGLWTLDLAGTERNETIAAMVEYLMKSQAEDGGWDFQSLRPPAASSRAMTTAIAVYGLRAYGPRTVDQERLQAVYDRARDWSVKRDIPLDQEETIGQIWLDYMLLTEKASQQQDCESQPDRDRLSRRQAQLRASQREEGGWAQTPDMSSDAYATGQALLMLAQTERDQVPNIHQTASFKKGIDFLLQSQQADGSWHVVTRSKPVQVYFDNGDPHGQDQFISMMATSWAVGALANFQVAGRDPLESARVKIRPD